MITSSSMNAGVAGLVANSNRLATVADNIANAATNGYKRNVAQFHSLVAPDNHKGYSAGGVRVTSHHLIDRAGSVLGTENPTDLAVKGGGFLPVITADPAEFRAGETPFYMTTTGSFRVDENGHLRSAAGVTLLGFPAGSDGQISPVLRETGGNLQPVRVPLDQLAAEPTTRIAINVNLPASETRSAEGDPVWAGEAQNLSVEYFDARGNSQLLLFEFAPLDPDAPPWMRDTWDVRITDSATSELAAAPPLVGEYRVQFNDTRQNGGTIASVLRLDGSGEPVGPTTPESADWGEWNSSTGNIQLSMGGNADTLIDINIGKQNTFEGLTQFSDSFAIGNISKDGSAARALTSIEVDGNGKVNANFSDGFARSIFEVPLVKVMNPNGMISHSNQLYSPSEESGDFFLIDAANSDSDGIVGYALEQSTIDMAEELTNLIQTQRAYSSSAKVITTVSEMLQATSNMKR